MNLRGVVGLLLLAGPALAQLDIGSIVRRVSVHVEFPNGGCNRSTVVQLNGLGGPAYEASPNEQCTVEFGNVPEGTYHLRVSGPNVNSTDDVVKASNASPEFEVKVKGSGDADGVGGLGPSVSVTALAIPRNALKKFEKAQKLMDHGEFAKAIQPLNEAVAIYPPYTNAYNNLAVAYARVGDPAKERDALQKAISIDEHFAPAYVNLGVLDVKAKNFTAAETELSKATSYDPNNALALVLLTYSEFMNHHFDLAIATSQRAHMLQAPHAFAHQVAARAYEQKRDGVDAIAELEIFLKEEPTGQRADIARKELAQVQAILQPTRIRAQ